MSELRLLDHSTREDSPAGLNPWLIPKARNRQPWSADELDRLCHMLTMGKPIRDIAIAFGRTQEAVRTKAYQLDRMTGPSL